MHAQDLLPARRRELEKFFTIRFGGYGWKQKVKARTGVFLFVGQRGIIEGEKLARLLGFVPADERPSAVSLERNFLARLKSLRLSINKTGIPLCQSLPFWHILDEFFAHRPHRCKHKRKHKDAQTDVIPLDLLEFSSEAQRIVYPLFEVPARSSGLPEPDLETSESWLTIPLGEPPGYPGPEGGEPGPPNSLSGSREIRGEPRVEDY
jgi:hypothetical protein